MVKVLSLIINKLLFILNFIIIFRYGKSIGDQLCISSLTNSIKRKYKKKKIILIVNYPELFKFNKDIFILIKFKENSVGFFYYKILFKLKGTCIKEFRSKFKDEGSHTYLKKIKTDEHIIKAMSHEFKDLLNVEDIIIKNKFVMTENERKKIDLKFNLPKEFVLIQSEAKSHYSNLKQWDINKIQKVLNNFQEFNWVQIGLKNDHKLKNVIDLRSKTSLREIGFLLSNAKFMLTHEGFYSHFSSCFNLKTFVIQSGISKILNMSYKNTINIQKVDGLDCFPCYLKSGCKKKSQECLENLSAEDVIDKVSKNI